MPRRIRVTELKAGMTVMRELDNGKFQKDCTLEKYFPTSMKFPAISFRANGNRVVIWHPAGFAWVE